MHEFPWHLANYPPSLLQHTISPPAPMYVSPNMTKLLFVRMHFIVTNVLSMLQEQHILLLLFLSLSMSLSSGLVDGNTDHYIQDTPLLLPETGDNIQVFLESILFYQTSLGVGLGDILF